MKQLMRFSIMTLICIALCASTIHVLAADNVMVGQAGTGPQVQQKQETGQDFFELLKYDHRRVLQIFDKFSGPPGQASPTPREVLRELRAELVPHMTAEENTLYAELFKKRATREIAKKTMAEHQTIKQVLGELDNMKDNEINASPKISEMKEVLTEHIGNEETVLFRRARDNFTPDQLVDLRERFKQEKIKAAQAR
jgi:hypothetical protein